VPARHGTGCGTGDTALFPRWAWVQGHGHRLSPSANQAGHSGFLLMVIDCAFVSAQGGDAQDKEKKGVVAALAPHKLDPVFDKAKKEEDVFKELMKNDLFKKAVKEAMKAKADQEEAYKKNPDLRSSTPAQAARQKFLEILKAEK
jgi:hypothetical protein